MDARGNLCQVGDGLAEASTIAAWRRGAPAFGGRRVPEYPIPPTVDLAALPRDLEGQWVLVKLDDGRQTVVSSGANVEEVVRGYPTSPEYLLTRVPSECTTYVVNADEG